MKILRNLTLRNYFNNDLILNPLRCQPRLYSSTTFSKSMGISTRKTENWIAPPNLLTRSRQISTTVEIENTPNPNAKMFYPVGSRLLPENAPESVSFDHNSIGLGTRPSSQLVEALLKVEGIYSVLLCKDYLTVVKERGARWNMLESQVEKKLSEFAIAGLLPSFEFAQSINVYQKGSKPTDEEDPDLEEIVEAIKVLIDTRARPMVMEDGGDIEFIKFDNEEGVVWVYMKGACEGCPSSTVTLQQGLTSMLKYFVPEVKEVQQCDENGDPLLLEDQF